MGIFTRKKKVDSGVVEDLQNKIKELKNEITTTDYQAFKEMFSGGYSPGVSVTSPDTAMRCSAVFACVRLISGAVASAPLKIYKRNQDGQAEQVTQHPYKRMLGSTPNDHLTAATFWKTMAANKVLNGNAYASIVRRPSGRPIGVVPLRPGRCVPYQAWELGLDKKMGKHPERLFYGVTWDNGKYSVIDQDDMIHVPNIGWNGKEGMSTISAGSQSMGLALSAEESAAKLFKNGLIAKLALKYDGRMDEEQQNLLREHINENHTGSGNHHKPLILTQGGDVKTLSMNADDAQLIESRQFSVIDIARFFGVPPVMIGETEKTSSWGSGVEQMARWFVMFTLNDHLTDIEQEIERKLFSNSEYFCKFDESELTRGDTKTRAEYNKAALGGTQAPAWMTQNEVRKTENLPPVKGGDELYRPVGQGDKNVEK